MNKITLRIHSVKCVDETGGRWAEKIGNDEISLSGFGIDARANTLEVKAFNVYSHFDDGEIKNFSPPRNFVTLDLGNGNSFPQSCSAGFLLAEIDNDDFARKSVEIYNKVKEEMNKEAEKRRLAARSSPAGVAGIDIPWGDVWKVVKPIIYGWIRDRISAGIRDDLFPPRDVTVTIPTANFSWNGSNTSPASSVEFRGHDGIYLLTYDWQLS